MTNPHHWQNFEYTSNDGLRLAGRKYGWENTRHLPVVCLPGLTRNSADFHQLAVYLAGHEENPRKVLCLDYRGRGQSEYDKNWQNYNPLVEAGDVIDGIIAAGLENVALIGTSRGGMIAMVLGAMRPGIMKAIILNDIGPEVDSNGLVRIKNYVDNAEDPKNWQDAVDLIKVISSKQFLHWDDKELDRQAHLIFKQENNKIVRQYDKRLAKTLASINFDQSLPTFWPQFTGLNKHPMMLIRGENSDIISQKTVDKMQQIHPGMKVVCAADQGHAPDLGTADLPQTIAKFIDSVEGVIA